MIIIIIRSFGWKVARNYEKITLESSKNSRVSVSGRHAGASRQPQQRQRGQKEWWQEMPKATRPPVKRRARHTCTYTTTKLWVFISAEQNTKPATTSFRISVKIRSSTFHLCSEAVTGAANNLRKLYHGVFHKVAYLVLSFLYRSVMT